ncbi:MAG: hypothetical protein GTN84_10235 [Hydrogenophaga sp.]|uniref:hypothetical protein n=1 Tax=Hydrogenophaga sp. TaxID=1904254 RepID=UPI0016A4F945|nr:hypothetical protein [Hydrogenophaga sp.]NIM41467.1 hypothetical protein [Hydrogenophaga sp.]NIN26783.1 hypothetical protein [Hydrogenophaga sp.]NIN31482.1 hypothetical protein [Hydrogenophaga sp.]NIN55713.1 hypothetical protein [Hydrogenophaga sp.]NIO51876.1 hypothetical protein [Hydrogenophaga sp.]
MSLGLDNAGRALPAALGVLLGIFLYAKPVVQPPAALPVLGLLVLILLMRLAREVFIQHPLFGLALLEPWILSSVLVVALGTQLLLWLALHAESWFAAPAAVQKTYAAALMGAVTAFLATAWMKDIQDAKGPFLPGPAWKDFARRFSTAHRLTGETLELEACDADVIASAGISGWGLRARWQRSRILSDYLRNGKRATPLRQSAG